MIIHEMSLMQWMPVIRECHGCDVTVNAWCLENNVNKKQFYYWQRRAIEEILGSLKKAKL